VSARIVAMAATMLVALLAFALLASSARDAGFG